MSDKDIRALHEQLVERHERRKERVHDGLEHVRNSLEERHRDASHPLEIIALDGVFRHESHSDIPAVMKPKQIDGTYRHGAMLVPEEIDECSGIAVFGRVLKSFVFTTDVVTIRNTNADAVLAVYPFTCQPAITQALLLAAECPVFTGVSGATTSGGRSANLAIQSEMQGCAGVVCNNTSTPETIESIRCHVDIPVVVTISKYDEYAAAQIAAGATIVNVAGGKNTADVVAQVRAAYPEIPIMASGGKNGDSIRRTIAAGADAITWTPPTIQQLEKELMDFNRKQESETEQQPA
jgi:hypothetical protein